MLSDFEKFCGVDQKLLTVFRKADLLGLRMVWQPRPDPSGPITGSREHLLRPRHVRLLGPSEAVHKSSTVDQAEVPALLQPLDTAATTGHCYNHWALLQPLGTAGRKLLHPLSHPSDLMDVIRSGRQTKWVPNAGAHAIAADQKKAALTLSQLRPRPRPAAGR